MPCWRAEDTPENRAGSNDTERTQDRRAWPFGVPSEESQLRKALGESFRPMPLFAKSGTLVLYDISLFHTRSDPATSDGRTRRTMHTYISRSSVPALTDWVLYPQRFSSDPFFCSTTNAVQKHFESLGSNVKRLLAADSVRELEKILPGHYSNVESVLSKVRHLS